MPSSSSFAVPLAHIIPKALSPSPSTAQQSTSAQHREVRLSPCFQSEADPHSTGTGAYKLGVNYAPGIMPQKIAAKLGYTQNLWLHGPEHYLTEVGTMNMFVVFRRDDGCTCLV